MSSPYLSEVKIFSFNFPPRGYAQCNGQLLSIQQNAALFSLLGTNYGGNGTTTFALPNLQGRIALHTGTNSANTYVQGQQGGEINHTITQSELPGHTHQVIASAASPNTAVATGNYWASNTAFHPYGTSSGGGAMANNAVGNTGGSQAHNNMSPYLVLNFCIALQGIFPSRN